MTRIFTDGAEMQDILFWDITGGAGAITVQNATPSPFASAYYYEFGASTASKNIPVVSEGYLRVRLNWELLTSTFLISFRNSATTLCYLGFDASTHWTAYMQPATVLEDSGIVINSLQWYLVEIYFKLANAPDGRFVVYVDGNKIIDFTGDTQPAALTTFDNIYFSNGSGGTARLYLDDLAFNDISNADGKNDNSWCGDGIVDKVVPDGDGTTNDWFNSAGDHVANWSYVDEFPKDNDITYVYHDGSISGHQDQYSLTHRSFTGKTILRIYPEARCRKTAAVAHTVKLGTLAAGGADVMSAARTLNIGAYTRIVGDEAKVNPVDTAPWEEADIDALEYVIETG